MIVTASDVNEPPVLSGLAVVAYDEGGTGVAATDGDNDPLACGLSGAAEPRPPPTPPAPATAPQSESPSPEEEEEESNWTRRSLWGSRTWIPPVCTQPTSRHCSRASVTVGCARASRCGSAPTSPSHEHRWLPSSYAPST